MVPDLMMKPVVADWSLNLLISICSGKVPLLLKTFIGFRSADQIADQLAGAKWLLTIG